MNLDSIDNAAMIISQIIEHELNWRNRNSARYRERVIFTEHACWKERNWIIGQGQLNPNPR